MPKRYAPVLSEMETLTVPYVVSAPFDSEGSQLSYSPTDSVTFRNESQASMFLKVGSSDWREIRGGQSRLAPIDMSAVPVWVKRGRDAPLIACLLEMVGKPTGMVVRATTVTPTVQNAGSIGPKGDKGDQGNQGAMGPIGPEGPRGLQGATGEIGPQGARGENGSVGPQGATGATGAAGSIGGQGPQGPSGTAGATGSQGLIGFTGPAGIQGLKGDTGNTGAQGIQGLTGATGPQGPIGLTGLAGSTGPQGIQGLTGATGPSGAQGPQGIQGATGPAGSGLRVSLASDVPNANAVANTIADVTGLQFPVGAGTRYKFRFWIQYNAAAITTGSRWTINGPSITELAYRSDYGLSTIARTFNEGLTAYNLPAASSASTPAVTGNIAVIEGVIKCSALGNVVARFASEIAASAITAKAGVSFVEYEAIA